MAKTTSAFDAEDDNEKWTSDVRQMTKSANFCGRGLVA